MARIAFEGIGGTGKAVLALLEYAEEAAGAFGLHKPPLFYRYRLFDQDFDAARITPILRPPEGAVRFRDTLPNSDVEETGAALAYFTEAELETEITRGFHAHPKLAAYHADPVVAADFPVDADLVVLVYSAIGGTGGGVGPNRLRRLIDVCPRVLALVFGRYLNVADASTGAAGFKELEHVHTDKHWLRRVFYNVPASQPLEDGIPSDGLNPAPALLLAVNEIWRLAADFNRVDDIEVALRRNQQQTANAPTEVVDELLKPERTREKPDVMTLVERLQAMTIDIRDSGYPGMTVPPPALTAVVQRKRRCSDVFGADTPSGAVANLAPVWEAWFRQGFTCFADAHAAPKWFLRAVAEGSGVCRELFMMLVQLHIAGHLEVVPTGKGQDLRLLATRRKVAGENTEDFVRNSVVGAFTSQYPPWTLVSFEETLRDHFTRVFGQDPAAVPAVDGLHLLLRENGAAAGFFQRARGTVLEGGHKLKLTVRTSSLDCPNIGWELEIAVNGWRGFDSAPEQLRSIKRFYLAGCHVANVASYWGAQRVFRDVDDAVFLALKTEGGQSLDGPFHLAYQVQGVNARDGARGSITGVCPAREREEEETIGSARANHIRALVLVSAHVGLRVDFADGSL
jgi:hypothetical protein